MERKGLHSPNQNVGLGDTQTRNLLGVLPQGAIQPTTKETAMAGLRLLWISVWGARGNSRQGAGVSGGICRTKACRRPLPASARASLRLPAAPDAQRWAAKHSELTFRTLSH